MERYRKLGIAILVLSSSCSALAFADVTAADVLNDLHEADRMEVHMGALAQEKGATDAVRDYGKTLVSDHKANDKKVMDVAAKNNVTIKPAKPGMMDKMEMKHLKGLAGSEFDQAFAKEMIEDHKKNIDKLQAAQKAALPEDVRKLVGDTLPDLQKHLEIAQKIYGKPS